MTRNWMNPLPHRLLCWMGLIKSPFLGRRPTLKEALTGNAPPIMSQKEWDEYFEWLDEMVANDWEADAQGKAIELICKYGDEEQKEPTAIELEEWYDGEMAMTCKTCKHRHGNRCTGNCRWYGSYTHNEDDCDKWERRDDDTREGKTNRTRNGHDG